MSNMEERIEKIEGMISSVVKRTSVSALFTYYKPEEVLIKKRPFFS